MSGIASIAKVLFLSCFFCAGSACFFRAYPAAAVAKSQMKQKQAVVLVNESSTVPAQDDDRKIPSDQSPGSVSPAGVPQIPDSDLMNTAKLEDGREDFARLLLSFKESSRMWPNIAEAKVRELIIIYFIDEYRNQGVTIKKSPTSYVAMIDGMARESPEMLNLAMLQVLRVAAIIEYDFDNGTDKDALAKGVLGPDGVSNNKKRLGIP